MKKWSLAAQEVSIPMPYADTPSRRRLVAPMTGSAVHSPFWGSQYSMNDQDMGIKTELFWLNVGQLQLGNSVGLTEAILGPTVLLDFSFCFHRLSIPTVLLNKYPLHHTASECVCNLKQLPSTVVVSTSLPCVVFWGTQVRTLD